MIKQNQQQIFSPKINRKKISQLSLQKLEKLDEELSKVRGGVRADAPPPPDPKPNPNTSLNPAP